MKKVLIPILLVMTFLNCKNKEANEEPSVIDETEAVEEIIKTTLEPGCYLYDENNNLISFKITSISDGVEGTLKYALDGKDSNEGSFKGTLEDDKLIGSYTFISEGTESTREVAFLVKDNMLVEGYGPLDGNGTAFRSRDSISYSSTMPLKKTDCN